MPEINFIGLANYQELMYDPIFWQSLKNTFVYVGTVVPISVFGGLFIALLIESRPSGKAFYRTLFFLPVMSSLVAMSIVWKYIMHPEIGLLNALLDGMGFEKKAWLTNPDYVIPALATIGIWQQIGYNMVLFMSGIMSIPKYLYEAAELDGVRSPISRFFLVTWPMLGPVSLFVFIISLIKAFQVFDTVEVLTQGGPGKSSEMLLLTIYHEGFEFFRTSYSAAITVVFLFILLLITIIKTQYLEKKVHYL